MMKILKPLLVVALLVACGLASFLVTLHASPKTPQGDGPHVPQRRGRQHAMAVWLELDDAQAEAVQMADATFHSDSARLAETLTEERAKLAAALEDAAASDQAILDQVERVIAAGNALERRVARHVVAIRPSLTPGQQRKLMGLCAQNVRRCGSQGGGRGKGGGRGRGDSSANAAPQTPGA
jgi:Spy/CpxP family protein refolding chaperone